MAKKDKTPLVVWLRRLTQLGFFVLFVYLFLETVYHPINRVGHGITFFFELDPLVLLTVWVASHAVPAALLFSLVTVVATLLFGRWFCGWVCPFGALHTFFSSLRKSRIKDKLQVGGYSRWQRAKYFALIVFLGGSLLGVNAVGWLDPFSFLYRATAIAVFPVTNAALQGVFTWLYDADPGIGPLRAKVVSEPVYDALRKNFLAVEQPHYVWAFLIGALLVTVVALNLYRARFWCRYICPLGALLGVIGKNPLVQVVKVPEQCNDCKLCVADCQGGANPSGGDGWKPAECLYCWNCDAACPTQGIRFRFGFPQEKKS
jgi:polyferredoxin